MTKHYGTYRCACGVDVSLSGMAYRSHERGRPHREAMHNQLTKCAECGQQPAGERDAASPYCGRCDPDGAKFFLASVQRLPEASV